MDGLSLRRIVDADLDYFYAWGKDPDAVSMAAFTSADPADRAAFDTHWARIRANPKITNRTIILNGGAVGSIACFPLDDRYEVTYWIDRAHWGRGIATEALALLLAEVSTRPLHAAAASDNRGSIRVLERNGFRETGRDAGFANGRGEAIEETLFVLDADDTAP